MPRLTIFLTLAVLLVAGCVSAPSAVTRTEDDTPTAESSPTPLPTAAPSLAASGTPTPTPIDFEPLIAAIDDYAWHSGIGPQFDVSVGLVDIRTGQTAHYDGDTRHLALSTFKGPLAAYYLWLIERGAITPQPGDLDLIVPMLEISDNAAATCILLRVGGLAPFNDWLVEQGMTRENNFVARWQRGCRAAETLTFLPLDMRYYRGDPALDIPGQSAWLNCMPRRTFCAEAFAPLELAGLYARLYRGEVLDAGHTRQWLGWMEKTRQQSALLAGLPDSPRMRAFVKNGFAVQDEDYPVNVFHEAGIIETPAGAYALAVFTQGNPEWPGTAPISRISRMVYDYLMQHAAAPAEVR